jgi:hypothetical protein
MLDYGAILRSGASLVPDLEQQTQEREMFRAWQQDRASQQQAAQAQAERGSEYQQMLEQALISGKSQDIITLMARFPEMRESIEPMYKMMDEQQRRRDVTALGSIYTNAQSGNWERAATLLQQRVDADGQNADPNDVAILNGLRSQNPVERTAAMQTVGVLLAAASGEDFTQAFGRLDNTSATDREYQDRLRRFGKAEADRWLAGQDVRPIAVEGGGSVFDARDFAQPMGGGDPASGGGATAQQAPILPRSQRPAGFTDDELFQAARRKVEAGADVDTVFRQLREWGVEI